MVEDERIHEVSSAANVNSGSVIREPDVMDCHHRHRGTEINDHCTLYTVHYTVILGRLQELEIAEIVIECSESPLLLTTWSISGNN